MENSQCVMAKKKDEQKKEEERPEEKGDEVDAGGEDKPAAYVIAAGAELVDVADMSDANPTLQPPLPPTKDEDGDGPTLRDTAVVKGKEETRCIPSVAYCESGSPAISEDTQI